MNRIDLSKFKVIKISTSKRKRNIDWEEAEQMANYLKLKPSFLMMLFKKFGKNKVLNMQSYLKDFNGNCKLEQALVWKLKNPILDK